MTTLTRDDVLARVASRRVKPCARPTTEEPLIPRAAWRPIREAAGLSQKDVAALVGVSEATVSRWESGDRTPRNPGNRAAFGFLLVTLAEAAVEVANGGADDR